MAAEQATELMFLMHLQRLHKAIMALDHLKMLEGAYHVNLETWADRANDLNCTTMHAFATSYHSMMHACVPSRMHYQQRSVT